MKYLLCLIILLAGCATAPTPQPVPEPGVARGKPIPESVARDIAERSKKMRAEFVRQHPCPASGVSSGACPGYVVDHIIPLSLYGADHPDNMQWQTVEAAKRKDVLERESYQRRIKAEKALCPKP